MPERLQFALQEPVKWEIPPELKGIAAFNPRHDIQDFLDLAAIQGKIPQAEFAQLQTQTIERTRRNLVKTVGERFRVRSSQIEYFIEGDILRSLDYPESVIRRYEKGKEFLNQEGSTETQREEAEIDGLQKIEKIFAEGKLKRGEKIVIVSAQGPEETLYSDNYFDIHQEIDGKIKTTRYHSTHSYEEFLEAALAVDPSFKKPQEELDAAFFLKRPVITAMPVDQILETFGLDLDTQLERTHQDIVNYCMPYINYYIRILIENPLNINEIKKAINTIYNISDQAKKKDQPTTTQQLRMQNIQELPIAAIMQNVGFYGVQPVRIVNNGCPGGQKGFFVNQPAPLRSLAILIGAQSVVDFAPYAQSENEDTSDFPCPRCGHIITFGAGIKECPSCGLPATCG